MKRHSARVDRACGRQAEMRCECGSLLALLKGDVIELKCRRCRRIVAVAKVTEFRGCPETE